MKDKFAYIVPPSPTSTVAVDSYHPTSNWWNGQWQYQDQSYLLHNPALRLPIERERSVDGSASRVAKNPTVAPLPLPAPTPNIKPEPDLISGAKEDSKSYVGWYVAGGLVLAIGGGYALYKNRAKFIKPKAI